MVTVPYVSFACPCACLLIAVWCSHLYCLWCCGAVDAYIYTTCPGTVTIAPTHNTADNPGNGDNTNYGAHCVQTWLPEASSYDVISFQFGLHDIAYDEERLTASQYKVLLANITQHLVNLQRIHGTKLLWVKTTPVPTVAAYGFECNGSATVCLNPARFDTDVVKYNAAAEEVVTAAIAQQVSFSPLLSIKWHPICAPARCKRDSCQASLSRFVVAGREDLDGRFVRFCFRKMRRSGLRGVQRLSASKQCALHTRRLGRAGCVHAKSLPRVVAMNVRARQASEPQMANEYISFVYRCVHRPSFLGGGGGWGWANELWALPPVGAPISQKKKRCLT